MCVFSCNDKLLLHADTDAVIDRKVKWKNKAEAEEDNDDDQMKLLVSAWDNLLLNNEDYFKKQGINKSDVPNAPHLENCKERTGVRERLDTPMANQTFPSWVCFLLPLLCHLQETTMMNE